MQPLERKTLDETILTLKNFDVWCTLHNEVLLPKLKHICWNNVDKKDLGLKKGHAASTPLN